MITVYKLLAVLLVAAGIASVGYVEGLRSGDKKLATYKMQEQRAVDAQILAAQKTTANWQQIATTLQEKADEQITLIAQQRDAAIADSLRQRSARRADLPTTPATTESDKCAGGNGAELSSGDAEFLARFAADAMMQQEELKEYRKLYGHITN